MRLTVAVGLRTSIAIAALAILLCSPTMAGEHEHREAGAHQHGHGKVSIAIEGGKLQLEMELPADDVVGFEHAAKSDADKKAVNKANEELSNAAAMFVLPAAAKCQLANSHSAFDKQGLEHAEFHATFEFHCANIKGLSSIGFKLFESFPNSKELEVGVLAPNGQKAFEVTPQRSSISLAGLI